MDKKHNNRKRNKPSNNTRKHNCKRTRNDTKQEPASTGKRRKNTMAQLTLTQFVIGVMIGNTMSTCLDCNGIPSIKKQVDSIEQKVNKMPNLNELKVYGTCDGKPIEIYLKKEQK